MLGHLEAVWRYRYFWLSLVKMDLMTRYRKSVLGIGWSLIYPLAMTTVFVLVFSRLLASGDWRSYSQNVLAAMTIWEFLKNSMSQGCQSLLRSEAYIRQAPLPFSIYTLRTVLGNAFHLSMSFIVLLALIAFLNPNGLTLNALYILPGLALAIVFGWAIATLTAFATAFFHDVTHMVEVFAQMMFFLTPIIYLPATLKEYQWTTNINPFALFIEMMRAPLIHATPASSEVYLYGGFFTLTAFTLAVGTIAWLQKKVIFHL